MSLDDQLIYIERWGVNQFEACRECKDSGLANRCFMAERISPRCGNCLRVGKACHFAQTIDSEDDEATDNDESDNVQIIVIDDPVHDNHTRKRRKGNTQVNVPCPRVLTSRCLKPL
jgi:hypothetical protein